ncbi:hypothetical protein BOTBODRAFT_53209 [Botryobasidium botryosum FD-172 SS1]|uniref:FYVE-type domain-containing protein n=1 Tax=Botryobasidium botryosum (strain FD-172 SS1) TaxID=930990 RepID=A0A067MSH6_BOTB1|nr:hypothetical protein BOTBODRAFT_53209 [Botryobasidium botryosum FD-172 SS1]
MPSLLALHARPLAARNDAHDSPPAPPSPAPASRGASPARSVAPRLPTSPHPQDSFPIVVKPARPCLDLLAPIWSQYCLSDRLAVLLPKELWKADGDASACEGCSARFNFLHRRHHCRKCGGIFCAECTAHTAPLKDTRSLPFIFPPTGYLLSANNPQLPTVVARVCNGCSAQLSGESASPVVSSLCSSIHSPAPSVSYSSRSSSASDSRPSTPQSPHPLARQMTGSTTSSPSRRSSRHREIIHYPSSHSLNTCAKVSGLAPCAHKDLESYPLKMPSTTCKVTRAAVWKPKTGGHVSDQMLAEVRELEQMDAEERAEAHVPARYRLRVDGDVKIRVPREAPMPSYNYEINWSTF